MNKKVNIQGISRMSPSNLSNDGLCRDIINARLYNGAVRPIGPHKSFQSAGVVSGGPCYIHSITNGDKYIIAYNSTTGVVSYTKVGGSTVTTLTTLAASQSIRFSSLTNILVIINDTDETMAYAMFSTDSETYNYIGVDKYPETLNIRFDITEPGGTYDLTDDDVDVVGGDAGIEAALRALDNLYTSDHLVGSIGVIYAWELYDGTVVKHSQPVYLSLGKWEYKHNGPGDPDHYTVKTTLSIPSYIIQTSDYRLNIIKNTYENIVKSLNIYITRPLNPYRSDVSATGVSPSSYTEVNCETQGDMQKKVMNDSAFYLVKSINLADLEFNYKDAFIPASIGDIANLEPLEIDNFSHHTLYSDNEFLYNSRLFLGNIKTVLFDGYSPYNFVKKSTTGLYKGTEYFIFFEVDIIDGMNTKTVVSDQRTTFFVDGSGKMDFTLTTYFSYPDSRATRFRVMVKKNNIYYQAAEYTLTPHAFHNFSYYITSDTSNIHQDDFVTQAAATENNIILDPNRVQASRVDNPFDFPAKNSYRVGHGEVIGMGANSQLVDTGQFGEFPIYVFTDSGIWAMAISADPSILIDRIVPGPPDVCSNGRNILSTVSGVVFFSDDGVMLISGMKTTKLSLPLEGDYNSILDGDINYSSIMASKLVADVSTYLEDESVSTFLSDAVLGYNYRKGELVISNPRKEYSYLYSFQTSSWYRAGVSYTRFVNNYPVFLGEKSGVLYDITEEDYSSTSYIPVFIETYPLKLDIDSFKKVIALAARGKFVSDPTKSSGVYLFASVDGVIWTLIGYNEKKGTIQDIILGRSPYSVVYLSVIISGTLGEDSYITHLDFAYLDRFRNRMR